MANDFSGGEGCNRHPEAGWDWLLSLLAKNEDGLATAAVSAHRRPYMNSQGFKAIVDLLDSIGNRLKRKRIVSEIVGSCLGIEMSDDRTRHVSPRADIQICEGACRHGRRQVVDALVEVCDMIPKRSPSKRAAACNLQSGAQPSSS